MGQKALSARFISGGALIWAIMLGLNVALLASAAQTGSVHGWGNYDITGRPIGLADATRLQAAAGYTYVLRNDGTVSLWGNNSSGQLNAPQGMSNVVEISAGYYMALALSDDGRVHVWGAIGHVDQGAILNPPADLTNAVAIAGGMAHCLALRADGTVTAWGSDSFGEREVPQGLSGVVRIAAGQGYSLAITSGGQIVTWGNTSFYGTIPADATNLVAVSLGFFGHGLGLRKDGTVLAWGSNGSGQASVPPGLSNVVAIAAGDQHSLALKGDGELVAWGADQAGQGTVPMNFVVAKAIAAGAQHNVVLSDAPLVDDVSPYQFVPAGTNVVMQVDVTGSMPWVSSWFKDGVALSVTTTTLNLTNVQAGDSGNYSLVARNVFGATTSPAITLDVYPVPPHWNQQPQNQAVLPGQTAAFFADVAGSEPLQFQWFHDDSPVPGATNATLQISPVSPSDEGSYAVRVWNDYGTITNVPCFLAATLPRLLEPPTDMWVRTNWTFSWNTKVLSPLPVTFQWYKDGEAIVGVTNASLTFSCVQSTDAGVYLLEVTNPNGSIESIPVRVTVLPEQRPSPEPGVVVEWGNAIFSLASKEIQETNLTGVAVGDWYTLLLRDDSTVRLWGDPQDFSLLIPPDATNVAQVFAGPTYALALKKDGTAEVWGGDSSALGLTAAAPGNSNVVSAAPGPSGCMLLHRDGSIASFPMPGTVPPEVTNITAVATTGNYAAALEASGKILVWGWGPSTEIPGLDKVVAIAGGESFTSLALRADGTVAEWSVYSTGPSWDFVAGITNAVAVAAGRGFMALLATGEVISWGGQYADAPPGLKASQISFDLLHQAALTSAPFFDVNPQSQTFDEGGEGTLAAVVRSATPLLFQWYFEGAPIPNATNSILNFSAARPSQSGHYQLLARNAKYQTASQVAVISVEGPAEFLPGSGDQAVRAGDALNLEISYGASPPATAQWRFNGLPILFATNTTLTLPDAQAWMAGSYTLSVSNAYGIVSSPPIHVVVSPSPPALLSLPSVANPVADGSTVWLATVVTGSEPLRYQWFFNDSPLAGQTRDSLELDSISLADEGAYQLTVTNAFGGTSSPPVMLLTARSAPSPLISLPHLIVREGKPVRLEANPGGTAGATFQWRFRGQALSGQTNRLLIIPAARLGDAGEYTVTATNGIGSGESAPTVLHVLPNPGAGLVKSWGEVRGNPDPLLAESVAAGASHCLALLPDGTVRGWGYNGFLQATPPVGLSNVVAISAGLNFSLALCSDGTVAGWGLNDQKQATPPAALSDAVAISAGESHALALKADGSVVGWGNTNFTTIPENLPPIVSIDASFGYNLVLDNTGRVWAWGKPNFPAIINVPPSASNIVCVAGGTMTAYALQSSGTAISWPSGTGLPTDATNLSVIAAGSAHGVGLRADGRLSTWGSDSYGQVSGPMGISNLLAVAAGYGTTLGISGEPRVISGPLSSLVAQGRRVALSVDAIGTGPLLFLWSLNGQPLPAATNATLIIESFDPTNAGAYSVQVRNGYASVVTSPANLALGLPPSITLQPTNQAVPVGSNATFTVQCSGTPTLYYQWALNGTNLLAATSSSLTLSNLLTQDEGSLSVVVSNRFGVTLSQEAVLHVIPLSGLPAHLSLVLTNSWLHFQLPAVVNRHYSLLTSTNLLDWVPVQSLSSSGLTNIDLFLGLPQDPVRFYRLREVDP